jgi:para-nitrobenzyl esterase
MFAAAKQSDVPLLTGWNGDDAIFNMPVTLKVFRENIKKQYGPDADSILKYYAATNDGEANVAQKNLSRDSFFGIQNYGWASMQSEMDSAKVFLYFFERKVPETGGTTQYGAFHSGEITYAYDNHSKFNRPWEQADFDLAKLMSAYWVNFAANGDPNGQGLPEWPAFNKENGMIMDFNVTSAAMKHPYYDALEFLYHRTKGM